jgi:hypothetical protein
VARAAATSEVFGLRNNTNGDLMVGGNYTNGSTYHVRIEADFLTWTIDAFINGTGIANDLPFAHPTTKFSELVIFYNGMDGVTNTVTFDNTASFDVPTPAPIAPLAAGLFGPGILRRQR